MASESSQFEISPPQTESGNQSIGASDSNKRKAEQGNGTQARTKRNRYISIACNECKRRKIKCNGQIPCQRCGHLNLECRYAPNCCNNNFKDSDEFRSMTDQITTLQDQGLSASLATDLSRPTLQCKPG
ncbi:Fungal transcriptional regulatory protein, N-terminal [Penicillium digitatum]|uniref:Fungal transcriptional regulatory protein, N-terminal n=1 Tax=Penicillium digitatum TaxID=36651 RepID=A0A7T6XPS0_PENDI|nr:Fungal transcriptional regulatory protein, N-terminal [Penicillium digitatum]